MNYINSALLSLNKRDLYKSAILAGLVVLIGALQQALQTHGFDFAAYDWNGIADVAIKAVGAYLVKNLFSTDEGKFLGKV